MFHSDDVKDILARAVKAVDDANVPPELRSLAFEKAVELLSKGPSGTAAATHTPTLLPSPVVVPIPGATGSSPLDRLVGRLRLTREVVEAVYTENGADLEVTVPPDRFARSKSAGAREIALLVAAARQAGTDEATTADQIRATVEMYDRYDQPNFAATLSAMKGTFLLGGNPRARTFKLTRPGWAAAAALVARLGGAENAAAS